MYNKQSACPALHSHLAARAARVQTGQVTILVTGRHLGFQKTALQMLHGLASAFGAVRSDRFTSLSAKPG